jgi:hypothetical protein
VQSDKRLRKRIDIDFKHQTIKYIKILKKFTKSSQGSFRHGSSTREAAIGEQSRGQQPREQ